MSVAFSFIITGAVLVSGYMLEGKLGEYKKEYDIKVSTTFEMRDGRTVDFEKLKAKNPDVRGWIWLPGTNIDYPIVQGKDNDYYLHRDLEGNYLYDGCIFIDASVEEPFSADENTVIYGHHMKSGAMFHDLSRYAREDDYMSEHDTIIIETEDGSYDMKVVAYCNEDADSELYTTYFEPAEQEDDFSEGGPAFTKSYFVELVKSKARKFTDESFGEDDRIVTLSTCTSSTGEGRHQIIGVLRPAATKEVVKTEKISTFNKWYALQIAVAAVMTISAFSFLRSLIKAIRDNHK